jgi:hypothetical protein
LSGTTPKRRRNRLDKFLFEFFFKHPISTEGKNAYFRFEKYPFPQRKINIYYHSKPSEHPVRGNCQKLAMPAPTVKRILSDLLKKELIEKQGSGRNVSYTVK